MNTKLPLLGLILDLSGVLGAQNAAIKTVPLSKTAKRGKTAPSPIFKNPI